MILYIFMLNTITSNKKRQLLSFFFKMAKITIILTMLHLN